MNTVSAETETALQVCKNCSNEFTGRFCNRCGEKVIDQHERSLVHFFEEILHGITHADGKIFRNLKLILLRPGILSKKYAEGVRQPFMKPISMFFVANLIYFLIPTTHLFNTPYESQFEQWPYSEWIKPTAIHKLQTKQITERELATAYNAKTSTMSKLLLILFVPMMAMVFAIVNFKRTRFFADHIIIALEFMCFLLFYATITLVLLLKAITFGGDFAGIDLHFLLEDEFVFTVPVVIILNYYFLVRAERTFYEQRWWIAFLKGLVILAALPVAVLIYRFILFYVTIAML